MGEYTAGMKASCAGCGAEIEYVGPYWRHVGDLQPKHPALPKLPTGQDQVPLQHWIDTLEPREQAQIRHATNYADSHASAGAPGHGQFILIAKLATLLDERERAIAFVKVTPAFQKIARSEDGTWRDVYTGVKVTL